MISTNWKAFDGVAPTIDGKLNLGRQKIKCCEELSYQISVLGLTKKEKSENLSLRILCPLLTKYHLKRKGTYTAPLYKYLQCNMKFKNDEHHRVR